MAPTGATMEEYWQDDFRPLNDASKAVMEALKYDETSPESDLYRRLASSGNASQQSWNSAEPYAQAHAYHNEAGESKPVTLKVEHVSSRPLPDILMQAKKGVHRSTFMGVLPPLGWGYMTADATIFVFSLNSDATGAPETVLSFENPRKQSIIGAHLVKPRPGKFFTAKTWSMGYTLDFRGHLLIALRSPHFHRHLQKDCRILLGCQYSGRRSIISSSER